MPVAAFNNLEMLRVVVVGVVDVVVVVGVVDVVVVVDVVDVCSSVVCGSCESRTQ